MSDFNHFIKSCKQRSVFTHNGTAPDGRYTDFFLISLLVDIGAVIDCVTAVAMFKCCIKKLYQCTAWCVDFFIMMSLDEFKIEIIELFQCTLQQVVQNMYTILIFALKKTGALSLLDFNVSTIVSFSPVVAMTTGVLKSFSINGSSSSGLEKSIAASAPASSIFSYSG